MEHFVTDIHFSGSDQIAPELTHLPVAFPVLVPSTMCDKYDQE